MIQLNQYKHPDCYISSVVKLSLTLQFYWRCMWQGILTSSYTEKPQTKFSGHVVIAETEDKEQRIKVWELSPCHYCPERVIHFYFNWHGCKFSPTEAPVRIIARLQLSVPFMCWCGHKNWLTLFNSLLVAPLPPTFYLLSWGCELPKWYQNMMPSNHPTDWSVCFHYRALSNTAFLNSSNAAIWFFWEIFCALMITRPIRTQQTQCGESSGLQIVRTDEAIHRHWTAATGRRVVATES